MSPVSYDTRNKLRMFMLQCLWEQIEELNKHMFITAKPMIYLVNMSEKDYIRKKNKWFVKTWLCCCLVHIVELTSVFNIYWHNVLILIMCLLFVFLKEEFSISISYTNEFTNYPCIITLAATWAGWSVPCVCVRVCTCTCVHVVYVALYTHTCVYNVHKFHML